MSRRKKKRESGAPMPAASAGLLRFFEEETKGIQIKPELIIVLSISLIIICLLAQIFYAGGLF
ncbi:MAG: preprotein translocase subunit Sec61beta [Candidatus Bathyarchaeota archaeon]|nr:MAG: preprotein translocase subunit Sec61beta [Candidatus Bathyarchaeota archaeon]